MNPVLIGGLVVVGVLMLTGHFPSALNPLKPTSVKPSGPGPASQIQGTAQQQGAISIGPLTLALPQAPNSALTTVAQTTQIANNALNQYNQLNQYVGGNADSSYPVPGDTGDYVDSGTGGYDFSNVYGD
jgi:hypothetical protein